MRAVESESGKVDKKKTRARSISRKKKGTVYKPPDNELTRYMFLELIVRIAHYKF